MIPLTLDEIVRVIDGRPSRALSPVSISGVATDSRTCGAGELFFALRGERFDGHSFVDTALDRGAVAAVVDQDVRADDRTLVRVGDTLAALGRLAAFHRSQRSTTVIAVTGSNGKTTTKCMVDHVLSNHLRGRAAPRSFNNAIGVPLTLLSTERSDDYLVVEIGSNAPGEVGALGAMAGPNVGVVTSIGEAHLAGFGGLAGVAAEKMSLLDQLRPGGLAVVNADMPCVSQASISRGDITVIWVGTGEESDIRISDVAGDLDETTFKINGRYGVRLAVSGRHNAMNAAAAFAVCRRMNVTPEDIVRDLSTFAPPPMRLATIRVGRLTLIDDSYNANPESMAAAVSVLAQVCGARRVFVAGDMLELGDCADELHERLGAEIAKAGIDVVVAVGNHAASIVEGARSAACAVETILYADASVACGDLAKRLHGTDTVLVKGSRRVGLDAVVRRVREVFGEAVACVGSGKGERLS